MKISAHPQRGMGRIHLCSQSDCEIVDGQQYDFKNHSVWFLFFIKTNLIHYYPFYIKDSFQVSFRTKENYVRLDNFFYGEKDYRHYMWYGETGAKSGKKFK